jgi:molybdenum cofactor cytidylyltransferase
MNSGAGNGAATGIVILAAGESSRMGQPKQLLPWNGAPLLRHIAGTALAAPGSTVIVVLGCDHERIRPALAGLDVTIVQNDEWREGMASSIRAGLRALPVHCDAALFLVCDQPRISAELLRRLIDARKQTTRPVVACSYGGSAGVPALFDRSLFAELLELHGSRGAKEIIRRHSSDVAEVPFPDGSLDLDTPADYRGAL